MIQSSEPRTFEQRFGTHCPFCGRSWGSQERCDPMPVEKQWRETNQLLFDRVEYLERPCAVCTTMFRPRSYNTMTCGAECSARYQREKSNERSRRRNERRREARAVAVVA